MSTIIRTLRRIWRLSSTPITSLRAAGCHTSDDTLIPRGRKALRRM